MEKNNASGFWAIAIGIVIGIVLLGLIMTFVPKDDILKKSFPIDVKESKNLTCANETLKREYTFLFPCTSRISEKIIFDNNTVIIGKNETIVDCDNSAQRYPRTRVLPNNTIVLQYIIFGEPEPKKDPRIELITPILYIENQTIQINYEKLKQIFKYVNSRGYDTLQIRGIGFYDEQRERCE